MEAIWTTQEIVAAIIGTGVISAVATALLASLRDSIAAWWVRRRTASYMAMRLAVLLEAYAWDCSKLLERNATAHHGEDDEFPDWQTRLPEPPDMPSDPNGWHAIDRVLAEHCLSLKNQVAQRQALVDSTIEHVEHELEWELEEQLATVGLEAWRLARDLRHRHELRQREALWDFPGSMSAVLEGARSKRKRYRERQGRMVRSLSNEPSEVL